MYRTLHRLTLIFPNSTESARLAAKYGYDEWLVGRFLEYVPEVKDFLSKMEIPPTQYIQVNTLKTSRDELRSRLRLKGFELKSTVLLEVLAVNNAPVATGRQLNTCLATITSKTSLPAWQ
jgi:tRNA (cytosine40_48-C5)-methyltransferase